MNLSTLAGILQGQLTGLDTEFTGFTIDSRTVQNGNCFIAIKGDVFDGHDFIADVAQKGAAVLVVDRDVQTTLPTITVKDTRDAFKLLGSYCRQQVTIPVAAITGSCGKTTTRALLENMLKQTGTVLASKKSFNNDIGLPLTLLQLTSSHHSAVLEIGTNHPGEIAALTQIAKPTVATVTMVAPVHIEYFGSVEAIAREKGAIFENLVESGTAVINADDVFAPLWKQMANTHRVITFGRHASADITVENVITHEAGCTTFTLVLPNEKIRVNLPLLGEHNIVNAMAASAMAWSLGAPAAAIKTGLETVQPEYGRLVEKKGMLGATVIDDSYNANPASVKAAITFLANRSAHPILVLGDMGELGDMAKTLHEEIGLFAKEAGVERLFCYGKNMAFAVQQFGANGMHFDSYDTLITALKKEVTSDATILVKGSRSMKMETVVNAIVDA